MRSMVKIYDADTTKSAFYYWCGWLICTDKSNWLFFSGVLFFNYIILFIIYEPNILIKVIELNSI